MKEINYKIKSKCITPCPYIKTKKYKNQPRVGSKWCSQCKYQESEERTFVRCKYEDSLINKLKLFIGITDRG